MISAQTTLNPGITLPHTRDIVSPRLILSAESRMQALWQTHCNSNLSGEENPAILLNVLVANENRRLDKYPGFPTIVAIDPEGMPVFQWIQEHAIPRFVPLEKEAFLYAKPEIAEMLSKKELRKAFKDTQEMDLVFSHFKEFLSAGVPRIAYINNCKTHTCWMSFILFHFFKILSTELYIIPENEEEIIPSKDLFPDDIPGWNFHAAIQISCQNGARSDLYILDPTLNTPVPLTQWIAGLETPDGFQGKTPMYYTHWEDPDILNRTASAIDTLFFLCDRYRQTTLPYTRST